VPKRCAWVAALGALLLLPVPVSSAAPLVPCMEPTFSTAEPDWASRMPRETPTTYGKYDVQIRSKDRTLVAARVYLPHAFPGRKPTVLIMSPYQAVLGMYSEETEDARIFEAADCMIPFLFKRGYAVVLADMRGTHNSDGCFDYGGPGDQQDGYAVVQWIARRPWSNGKVGMYGVSHVGMSQYSAAVAAPPALKAIIPVEPISSFYRYLYNGGVHYETNVATPPAYDYGVAGPPPTNAAAANFGPNLLSSTCNLPKTPDLMSLDGDFTSYWHARDYARLAKRIKAAVFHVHGTLDQNVKMDHFTSMWKALEEAHVPRKALIGPWKHSEPDVDYWHLTALRWFEHWLHGNDTGMMREPKVTMISSNHVVRTASSFPGPVKRSVLYASSGELTAHPSSGTASYTDVPGMQRQMMMNAEGARLMYDSAPVATTTRIVGVPVVDLHARIDKPDTNFAALLYDIAPDGTTTYVTRGYIDAKHRSGLSRGTNVQPGRALEYRIELLAQDYIVRPRHMLRLLLASTDSCQWQVDAGPPGCESSGVVSDATVATVTVLEGRGLTRVILPIGGLGGGHALRPAS
jgi:X-Pro dipeptidyl-peptidase